MTDMGQDREGRLRRALALLRVEYAPLQARLEGEMVILSSHDREDRVTLEDVEKWAEDIERDLA